MPRLFKCFLAAVSLSMSVSASAQAPQTAYPTKSIRLVVPYPAGGTADAMARALGQELTTAWGQTIVIDNRPGGGTILGAETVARAAPDGYTILFATDSTLAINPTLYRRLPYDPVKDFVPITVIGYQDLVLVVNPGVPAKSLAELIALAKAKPGALNYASFGNGSQPHLAMEMFMQLAQISMVHVPYKGVAPVITDLVGGTIQVAFLGVSTAGLNREGKVRALAMGGTQRSVLFNAVPTFAEEGFPEMYARAWWGIVAPAATPREIVAKLSAELVRIVGDRDFQAKRMQPQGLEPVGNSGEEFAAIVRADTLRWAKVIKAADVQPE